MELLNQIAENIDEFLWGVPMILILLGTHIFMTVRTKFIQRKTFKAIKLSVTKDPDVDGDISPFQALTTALASTIGTGNIIGVGTAIALGGAGAVLWCWLTGVFGIATKYAESLIAVKYRVKTKDGKMQGGAMYAIERGLHPTIGGKKRSMKWLAILFAVFAALASFGIGCGVQTNAISNIMDSTFNPSMLYDLSFINSDKTTDITFSGYDKIYDEGIWSSYKDTSKDYKPNTNIYINNSYDWTSPCVYYTTSDNPGDSDWLGVKMSKISDTDICKAEIPSDAKKLIFMDRGISTVSLIAGVIVAICVALVIFGGIKSISKVCEKLVPFMAIMYVVGCVIILVMNSDVLWQTVCTIVSSAFSPAAVGGGLVGSGVMLAARFGVARGLFSNESGMGSAPIVASAAQSRNPVRQAMISATGTFWDTVVVCLMTGLVIVSSCIKNPQIDTVSVEGGKLTSAAFAQIPVIGTPILVVGIVLFAFSTILGWSYYGERCIEYLFGRKGVLPYKLIFVAILLITPVVALDLVWTMSDIFNALMALPNIVAIVALSPVIVKETNYYLYGNRIDEFDKTPIPVVDK